MIHDHFWVRVLILEGINELKFKKTNITWIFTITTFSFLLRNNRISVNCKENSIIFRFYLFSCSRRRKIFADKILRDETLHSLSFKVDTKALGVEEL